MTIKLRLGKPSGPGLDPKRIQASKQPFAERSSILLSNAGNSRMLLLPYRQCVTNEL
jgi:hypothetical protein